MEDSPVVKGADEDPNPMFVFDEDGMLASLELVRDGTGVDPCVLNDISEPL